MNTIWNWDGSKNVDMETWEKFVNILVASGFEVSWKDDVMIFGYNRKEIQLEKERLDNLPENKKHKNVPNIIIKCRQ